jgi:endonuclease/exonuclease/phosphatase family metal-dependent hydrolase
VVLETTPDGHWLHVRADDGTAGWVVEKYVGGENLCPTAAPGPQNVFVAAVPGQAVSVAGTQITPGDTLTVVSYNLWELYDGRGGDRYLGEQEHPEGATLDDVHAARRVEALAAALKGAAADVYVFQEVENAVLACALARAAAGEGAWTCWASDWAPEPHPQNVAVASRVPGAVLELDPGPGMGQRGALEFTLDGGALRIAAVHLKSSVGASGAEDCGNAAKRMAVAYGLLERRKEFPDAAYLVIGDLNVDPGDAVKDDYDFTDEILARDGGEDLVRRFLGEAPAVRATVWGSVIDRAFLRRSAGIDAASLRFAVDAPLGDWASDHRPLIVVLGLTP